jgi:hypothetical protein
MAAAIVPVFLAALVYYPITKAYFHVDDFVTLLSIVNDDFLRFLLRPFGGHNYLVRNLAFYGSYQVFGLRPELFLWTVLLTHLVNVWLLFRILRTLTASLTLACFGAALWGTCPIHVGTLGWYSVYGNVLAATVLLIVLDQLTGLARGGGDLSGRTAAVWYALLLLGTTCFGVGVGVALVFPFVLFLLLPGAWRRPGVRLAYLALPLVTVALYFGFRRLHGLLEPPLWWEEHIVEHASLARLGNAARMLPDLVSVSVGALLRGFLPPPRGRGGDSGWLATVCFALALAWLLRSGDAAMRRTVTALAILCVASYLIVAAGRVPLFPDAKLLVDQPRYHYVASIPIVLLMCLVLSHLAGVAWLRMLPRAALLLIALAVGVYVYARSDFRIDDHAAARRHLDDMLRGIAVEVQARPPGSIVYLENGTAPLALGGMPDAEQKWKWTFPGRAAAFLLVHQGEELDGRRVRFVERDSGALRWFSQWPDTPLARLLVGPDAVPAR